MVPVPLSRPGKKSPSTRLIFFLFRAILRYVFSWWKGTGSNTLVKRKSEFDPHRPESIAFAVLIPVLVLSSGLFAGLTLGYMSLDETQLNVLSISGTPKQREYAAKILPVRKNGHLLLVTLLLGNMIVNETLPIIADPVLGGGVVSVVVSTVLIVIFAEIIPQSLFTRHGLFLGAKMARFTMCLIYLLGVVSWPVAKLLEFVLGPHHGIIYRRAELKELIAMHSSHSTHGGDLKKDTVAIIGATLDLQEKVVMQAMTPMDKVFTLSLDAKLDEKLLRQIFATGHSRIPVYEEVDIPVSVFNAITEERNISASGNEGTTRVKKIVGILLVKKCVLLDAKAGIPIRDLPLNKVPFVPRDEPLLGMLDRFQEGRSHMAIVSRYSVAKAASVKKAVKRGLTHRLRQRVGMSDGDSSDDEEYGSKTAIASRQDTGDSKETIEGTLKGPRVRIIEADPESGVDQTEKVKGKRSGLTKAAIEMASMTALEQMTPADAVLDKAGAEEFLRSVDPAVMPLGIITLEDVLEELIGEEIYDEFDEHGAHGDPYVPNPPAPKPINDVSATPSVMVEATTKPAAIPLFRPAALRTLDLLNIRSRSAPPIGHDIPPPSAEAEHQLVGEVASSQNILPAVITNTTYDEDDFSGGAISVTERPGAQAGALGQARRRGSRSEEREVVGRSASLNRSGIRGSRFKSSPIGGERISEQASSSKLKQTGSTETL